MATILTLEGATIRSFKGNLSQIDVSFLPRGYYLLLLEQGDRTEVHKFFKQ